jgi:hypothetical protein
LGKPEYAYEYEYDFMFAGEKVDTSLFGIVKGLNFSRFAEEG